MNFGAGEERNEEKSSGEKKKEEKSKSPHLKNFKNTNSGKMSRTHPEAAYREQVEESVTAALFLRFFVVGLSTLSLGSRVRMRCGVLVLKSA